MSGYWTLYQTDRSYENPREFEKAVLLVKEIGRDIVSPFEAEEDIRLRKLVYSLIKLGVEARYLDQEAIDVMNADDLRKGFYWDLDYDFRNCLVASRQGNLSWQEHNFKICDYEWRWVWKLLPWDQM